MMGFTARNIESIFLLDPSDEEERVARIEELIGDGARLVREEVADAGRLRGWVPVQVDDAWPGGACRADVSRDVVAVLQECRPGSAVEYFDEDGYQLYRFEKKGQVVRGMSCEPMGYWDIGREGAGEIPVGGGYSLIAAPMPEAGAIAVDVKRPDGKTGQIAYIERTPEGVRESYPTEFHVFCYDGEDESPSSVAHFDPRGEAVAYPPRKN